MNFNKSVAKTPMMDGDWWQRDLQLNTREGGDRLCLLEQSKSRGAEHESGIL